MSAPTQHDATTLDLVLLVMMPVVILVLWAAASWISLGSVMQVMAH